jgi:anti-sigma factor RsiW
MSDTDQCTKLEAKFIEYLDGRAKPADRREVEEHLAACAKCHEAAAEFSAIWTALDDVPELSVSPSFDARLRARIAGEPVRWRMWAWMPSPRLSLATAALVALSVWISFMPQWTRNHNAVTQPQTAEADFRMIRDLPILENYDVVSQFDVLSELPAAPDATPAGK